MSYPAASAKSLRICARTLIRKCNRANGRSSWEAHVPCASALAVFLIVEATLAIKPPEVLETRTGESVLYCCGTKACSIRTKESTSTVLQDLSIATEA